MKIEKAQFSDLPEIAVLQKLAFYQVAVFYNNFKLKPLLATLSDLENTFADYQYLKVTIDNRIAGSVRGKINENYCKIENMVVHPGYQRKGIGNRLLSEIENSFPDIYRFLLFTGKNTPGNVNFYQKAGYTITSEIPATDTEPIVVQMEKQRLKSPNHPLQ